MEIKAGQYYRRKSDGAKLMALELTPAVPASGLWRFWECGVHNGDEAWDSFYPADVEPWTDPPRLVPHWPAICRAKGGAHYCSAPLYHDEAEARRYNVDFVRLATEYPAVMLETSEGI